MSDMTLLPTGGFGGDAGAAGLGGAVGGPAAGALGQGLVLAGLQLCRVRSAAVVVEDGGEVGFGEAAVDGGMSQCPVDVGGVEQACQLDRSLSSCLCKRSGVRFF